MLCVFLGRKIFLRHIRNEVELPEITKDYHYDFNFQVIHVSKGPYKSIQFGLRNSFHSQNILFHMNDITSEWNRLDI